MRFRVEFSTQRLIVYVDGFNLYHGMRDKHGRTTLWLDLVTLSQALRPAQELVAVRYFTARVSNNPQSQARQEHYVSALSALHGEKFGITWGRYQAKNVECRECGAEYLKFEEKETDVNIAISLVSDAALNLMDTALIISADSDLGPAVRAAKNINPNLFIAAAFPPARFSFELQKLMPSSFQIGYSRLKQNQMPEKFVAENRTFSRPIEWNSNS